MQHTDPARTPRARKPCSRGQVGAGADRGRVLILGAIIAGGRASRFGSDKALALLDDRPLIAHARAIIAPFVDVVVICGTPRDGLDALPDRPSPCLGPLGGIAAALAHGRAIGARHVLTIGCDMPRVPSRTVAEIIAAAPAWCTESPILACWTPEESTRLEAHLRADGDRSIRRWARMLGMQPVSAGVDLPNVNTPQDLAKL